MSDLIPIGTAVSSDTGSSDIGAFVRAPGLNRHTFWCGQSGSGKTYALGVLLEQVLLHTRLPILVLDPNSDFVRLSEVRDDAPAAEAQQLRSRTIRVLRSEPGSGEELKVRFLSLSPRTQAAVLQLDPILDAEDFNAVLNLVGDTRSSGLPSDGRLIPWLRASESASHQRIALRLENLGIADWPLWAWNQTDITGVLDDRADATVVDLGRFNTPTEPQVAALAALDHLWAHRHERIPRLIVIDEAHNLCPPDPATPIERLLTERIIQIAAEGRKYGLWLLLSTQRPGKVHPNIVSQCDNLGLLRMNSPKDLDDLALLFGFAPAELLSRSPGFAQGQALFSGGFVEESQIVQMGTRLTEEGGSDVTVPLR